MISVPGSHSGGPESGRPANGPTIDSDLRLLFHRLNNQLGIILAHAELLEAKSADDVNRARGAARFERPGRDGHGEIDPTAHRTGIAGSQFLASPGVFPSRISTISPRQSLNCSSSSPKPNL